MLESKSIYLHVNLDASGMLKIVLNKAKRKNAFDTEMIASMTELLTESAKNSAVKLIVITGSGDFFTSGNDLSNFQKVFSKNSKDTNMGDIEKLMYEGTQLFKKLVDAFIDYPKPLVAVVNGHAIGMGVTLLPHFDLVFASNTSTFYCPFVKQGLTPEACSSVTFQSLMGYANAAEMLLFGKKITAIEALERNLVTEVYDDRDLPNIWDRIRDMCSLPPNSMAAAKSLLKRNTIADLHQVNEYECNTLINQWKSDEFVESLMKFMMRSKL